MRYEFPMQAILAGTRLNANSRPRPSCRPTRRRLANWSAATALTVLAVWGWSGARPSASPAGTVGRHIAPTAPAESRHAAAARPFRQPVPGAAVSETSLTPVAPVADSAALIADLTAAAAAGMGRERFAAVREENADAMPDELLSLLASDWAERDPKPALAWASGVADVALHDEILVSLGIGWAIHAGPEAVAWSQSLKNEGLRERVQLAIGSELARADPAQALGLVDGLPPSVEKDALLMRVVGQMTASAPPAVVSWAQEIEDESVRADCLALVATVWASQDPGQAALLTASSIPAGGTQERAVVAVVQRWAQQDPEAAANWVAAFPQGTLQDIALENLVINWAHGDRQAAADWISTLEAPALRALGAAALARAPVPIELADPLPGDDEAQPNT